VDQLGYRTPGEIAISPPAVMPEHNAGGAATSNGPLRKDTESRVSQPNGPHVGRNHCSLMLT